MDYRKRQEGLIASLRTRSLDAFLVRKKQNIRYLTGAGGEDAALFISGEKRVLFTDPRYKEECTAAVKNCRVAIVKERGLWQGIADVGKKTRSRRVGFESHAFSYSEYSGLKRGLKGCALVPLTDAVESLRMTKERSEIACIKRACKSGCDIMKYALRSLSPSLSEASVKNKINAYVAKKGLRLADFDIIVASGKNASMPHAAASGKRLRNGEMVVIDLGARDCGYNSDLTRTAFLGRINRKYSRVYNIVLDAQRKAIEHIKSGITAGSIDTISRKYISEKGLGRYFIHSLGHGIGLETHEGPRLSANSATVLKKNMTMTVEPGVYIPGWGGVRIEDVVLITETGSEILTGRCKKRSCR